ncbi:unnamed protein product [Lathyrus sativus]|nr:unnamed protein product [Lathyrus sativus]
MWLFNVPNLKNIGDTNNSLSLPFSASNCVGTMATDFPRKSNMATSIRVDESGFLQSSENMEPSSGLLLRPTREVDARISDCPNLPPHLICKRLKYLNATMHADAKQMIPV